MVGLIKIAVSLLADAIRFVAFLFRSTRSLQAENLFFCVASWHCSWNGAFGHDG